MKKITFIKDLIKNKYTVISGYDIDREVNIILKYGVPQKIGFKTEEAEMPINETISLDLDEIKANIVFLVDIPDVIIRKNIFNDEFGERITRLIVDEQNGIIDLVKNFIENRISEIVTQIFMITQSRNILIHPIQVNSLISLFLGKFIKSIENSISKVFDKFGLSDIFILKVYPNINIINAINAALKEEFLETRSIYSKLALTVIETGFPVSEELDEKKKHATDILNKYTPKLISLKPEESETIIKDALTNILNADGLSDILLLKPIV